MAVQAVGASGAASIRPSLARSVKRGPQAVRRAALSAAQEQKLILCTSLLKEVWELHASVAETGPAWAGISASGAGQMRCFRSRKGRNNKSDYAEDGRRGTCTQLAVSAPEVSTYCCKKPKHFGFKVEIALMLFRTRQEALCGSVVETVGRAERRGRKNELLRVANMSSAALLGLYPM